MNGMLYVVGTPIGNLGDVTLRALEVLKSVDLVFAEDTRVTKRLFERYDITTPLRAYHARSGTQVTDSIISELEAGKQVALVTDAGTPGISDPGSELVAKVRAALPELKIVAIPGPSALTSALSIAGLPSATFVFLGFLPHKKGRQTLLKEIATTDRTVVLYESPHRILKLLEELNVHMPDRTVAILREITKQFESSYEGTPYELLQHFSSHTKEVKGEFVVVIAP
jgi:16S rRNA (cytidine1402-2'-O)-methyltransferase